MHIDKSGAKYCRNITTQFYEMILNLGRLKVICI
jgi:hypothetical protein